MDAIQHDYGNNPILYEPDAPSRFGGRKTEQQHTFSNPISFRHDLPNWLVDQIALAYGQPTPGFQAGTEICAEASKGRLRHLGQMVERWTERHVGASAQHDPRWPTGE